MTYRTCLTALVLLAAGGLGCTPDKETTSGTSTSETSTSTGDESSSSTGPTSTTTGPSDPTTTTDTSTTIPGTTSSTSSTTSAPSEPPDELGRLQIESPDEGEILYNATEDIHVVLHDQTAGELIEIRVWSEEGLIDEPTCDVPDCTVVLDMAGVAWGRQFRIGASADVMTDEGVVTIDATPVEVEHISP